MKRVNKQQGFTIVELMIATGVFSVLLLICTTALLAIGRTFNKGTIAAQTQEAARGIMEDVSRQLQFSSDTPVAGTPATFNGLTVNSFCIGEVRYSYATDAQVDDSVASGTYSSTHRVRHAFWRDTTYDAATCPPANLTVTDPDASGVTNRGVPGSGQELIPVNMRLKTVSVSPGQGKLWYVQISLVYGDDDVLARTGGVITGCRGTDAGGSFCAVSELSTEVYRYL